MRSLVGTGLGVVLLLVAVLGAVHVTAKPATPMALGVLPTRCDPARLPALTGAGVTTAVLAVTWSQWQPAPDRVDGSYVEQVSRQIETCRGAGVRVVLSPGLQYPPEWVRALPNAALRDQTGSAPEGGPVNLIFSQDVRDAAARYLRDLVTWIGPETVDAVRVGTTASGELGYPGPADGGADTLHGFWAFDDAALTGRGLATGQTTSPLSGWVPGTVGGLAPPAAAEAASRWYGWYVGALVQTVVWQTQVLHAAGFRGEIHLPLAGRGVSPSELRAATADVLRGAGDPEGAIERGLLYREQLARLAGELAPALRRVGGDLVVDVTGLDDASAVRARALPVPQDACRDEDVERVEDGYGVDSWSSFRWTSAVARAHGLRVVGENPGAPVGASTGAVADSDPLPAQLDRAPAYARGCGLVAFFFAFEDDLFAPATGVSPAALAAHR